MLQLDIHTSLAATRVDSSTISPTIVVVPHLNRRENSDSMAVALEEEEGEGAIKKETFIHSDLAQKQHKESPHRADEEESGREMRRGKKTRMRRGKERRSMGGR